MKKPKSPVKRITLRLRADLTADAKKLAAKKRWSLNDFIEEAVILAVAESSK